MKLCATALAALLLLTAAPARAEPALLSIAVIGADTNDPRWAAVEEAVEFWNRELTRAGARVRFGRPHRRIEAVDDDAFDAASEDILRDGWTGRLPEDFQRIPANVIVILANGRKLVSFGMRRPGGRGGLVGLRRADVWPLSLPNVMRNVVAHELGHVLGLGHNNDPATLMCGRPASCRPDLFASDSNYFFPVTEAEQTRLRARW